MRKTTGLRAEGTIMINYLKMEFLSLSANEGLARTAAAAFFAELDPTMEDLADVRTAVSEAVTNAIVHGYRNKSGSIIMECSIEEDGLFMVSVSDKGCGIADIEQAMEPFFTTARGEERTGMGFAVMKAFMDSVDVKSAPGVGTTVIMTKRVYKNGEDLYGE